MTSTGAKSGAERLNLIGYFDIDGTIYVVGSAAGREQSPGWVFNLLANPNVTVEIGSDPPKTVVAHELPRDERDRIYAIIVQRAPGFGDAVGPSRRNAIPGCRTDESRTLVALRLDCRGSLSGHRTTKANTTKRKHYESHTDSGWSRHRVPGPLPCSGTDRRDRSNPGPMPTKLELD